MQSVTISDILQKHHGLLLDAYGVLVAGDKTLPGAAELLEFMRQNHRPFALVTNDASAHPQTLAKKYTAMGLPVSAESIYSSGYLVVPYFKEHRLVGANTWVMGSPDVHRIVVEAGGEVSPIDNDNTPDVIVCADEAGFDFLPTIERVIATAFRIVEARRQLHLLLPNPDRIYPKGNGEIGIAAGSIAMIVDDALKRRFGDSALQFVHLGKPQSRLFLEAAKGIGQSDVCMIGDQLDTDVLGAKSAGFAAALVTTGVGRPVLRDELPMPDYLLSSLSLKK